MSAEAMSDRKQVLDGVMDGETVLDDAYPVYGDYLYVADGKVIRSDVFGTVRHLKADTGAKEIRRCNMAVRNLF